MNPWPRNDYLSSAHASGIDRATALSSWRQAHSVQRSGFPAVLSLRHLAEHTDNSYEHLRAIVARRVDPYRVFRIRKRLGGYRQICVPEPGLLRTQRWIDRFILSRIAPHESAKAYVTGASIVKCAAEHAGCRWLIKCDIRQFFESISEIQVYRIFHELGYQPLVCFELARIATRTVRSTGRMRLRRWKADYGRYVAIPEYWTRQLGHLPQGALTSPRLSNLAMRELDHSIQTIADRAGLWYSRYADDLIFSAHEEMNRTKAREILFEVFSAIRAIGLRPHSTKTVIVPPGARRIVLGLCVNDITPRLSRDFRKRLQCHVHYVCRFGIVKHARNRKFDSVLGFREHLKGLLRFAHQVEPIFANSLLEKLNSSDWAEF